MLQATGTTHRGWWTWPLPIGTDTRGCVCPPETPGPWVPRFTGEQESAVTAPLMGPCVLGKHGVGGRPTPPKTRPKGPLSWRDTEWLSLASVSDSCPHPSAPYYLGANTLGSSFVSKITFFKHSPGARHCSKDFTSINSVNNNLRGKYSYSLHLTDEKTEAQRCQGTCLK